MSDSLDSLAPPPGRVAPGYVHRDKTITPREGLALDGGMFKWYDLASPEMAVPSEINRLGRAFLERENAGGRLGLEGDLGFVILHRCGAEFYFLLLSTWRNENELWEAVYAKPSDAHPDFEPFTFKGPMRGTFCVWELGAVWHEQQAWRRFLFTARDAAARRAYLADEFVGAV
jgi:hypothetical protein